MKLGKNFEDINQINRYRTSVKKFNKIKQTESLNGQKQYIFDHIHDVQILNANKQAQYFRITKTLILEVAKIYQNKKQIHYKYKLYQFVQNIITQCQSQSIKEIDAFIAEIQYIKNYHILCSQLFSEQPPFPANVNLIIMNQKRQYQNKILDIFANKKSKFWIIKDFLSTQNIIKSKFVNLQQKQCKHLIQKKIYPSDKFYSPDMLDEKQKKQQTQRVANYIKRIMKIIYKTQFIDIRNYQQKVMYNRVQKSFLRSRSQKTVNKVYEKNFKNKIIGQPTILYYMIDAEIEKQEFINLFNQFSKILRPWLINFNTILHVIDFNLQNQEICIRREQLQTHIQKITEQIKQKTSTWFQNNLKIMKQAITQLNKKVDARIKRQSQQKVQNLQK